MKKVEVTKLEDYCSFWLVFTVNFGQISIELLSFEKNIGWLKLLYLSDKPDPTSIKKKQK